MVLSARVGDHGAHLIQEAQNKLSTHGETAVTKNAGKRNFQSTILKSKLTLGPTVGTNPVSSLWSSDVLYNVGCNILRLLRTLSGLNSTER